MKTRYRIVLLATALLANGALAVANVQAGETDEGTWRHCNCKLPPSNCCTVEAGSCNGCIVNVE